MSARWSLALCSFALVALLGCGSTVIVAPAGDTDAGATPSDTASPVDASAPPVDRVTPVVDVAPIVDVPRVCILSNGVRCPAGQACSDGCNTCFCAADGLVTCTGLACIDAGPPGGCRSRADCGADQECNFREPGCGMTGVCAAITDCAAIRPYCGCDGSTFRDCPGSAHQPYVSEGECTTTVDAGIAMDSAVCAGASIGPTGAYCAGPTDRALPMECCTGWDCDDRTATCGGRADPCPPGQVHLIAMGCWGACVPAGRCRVIRCDRGFCPHGFTCDDSDSCVPIKID